MSAKPATDEAVRKLSEELAGADSNHTLVTGVGRVRRLVSRIDADAARIAALEEALLNALPLVEEAEFLESHSYSYGSGGSEPSPAEWGISVGYQQTREAMPREQYLDAVEEYHRNNRDEDDGDGEFLTAANKIRALLEAKP